MKRKFISNLELNHDLLILNDTDTGNVKFQGPTILDIHDLAHLASYAAKLLCTSLLLEGCYRKQKNYSKADEIIVSAPNFEKWVAKNGRNST